MMRLAILATFAVAALFPAGASAKKLHECQHPVTTGAEVYHLRNISAADACPPVLKLYDYERKHEAQLYGCSKPDKDGFQRPFLKRHHFRGFRLSLGGKYGYAFTMSRGDQSFRVSGTDFPVNCA